MTYSGSQIFRLKLSLSIEDNAFRSQFTDLRVARM
jgi:hypothetical protein